VSATDTPTGYDRTPDRYAHARETIDEMRDLAHAVGLGDEGFAFHCLATALKYWRRTGLKGDADEDRAKQRWYEQMAHHAMAPSALDPRCQRPDYAPYEPRLLAPDLLEWLGQEYKPAPWPDVPTAEAVAAYGPWWQFGDQVVAVDVTPRGLRFWRTACMGAKRVDPAGPWLGPVQLRPNPQEKS